MNNKYYFFSSTDTISLDTGELGLVDEVNNKKQYLIVRLMGITELVKVPFSRVVDRLSRPVASSYYGSKWDLWDY